MGVKATQVAFGPDMVHLCAPDRFQIGPDMVGCYAPRFH